jgi:hypothetical protein
MPDFPTTNGEFEAVFKTEEDCLNFIISVRWPDGQMAQFVKNAGMTSFGVTTKATFSSVQSVAARSNLSQERYFKIPTYLCCIGSGSCGQQ